jgi:hypothetical protein
MPSPGQLIGPPPIGNGTLADYNTQRAILFNGGVVNGVFVPGVNSLPKYKLAVSGEMTYDGDRGWPLVSPSLNYNGLRFFYEDTGKQESVTVQVGAAVGSLTGFSTQTFMAYGFYGQFGIRGLQKSIFITHATGAIVVGGDVDGVWNGQLEMHFSWQKGFTRTVVIQNPATIISDTGMVPDSTDPISLLAIQSALGTFQKSITQQASVPADPFQSLGTFGTISAILPLNKKISSGRYEFSVDTSTTDDEFTLTNAGDITTVVWNVKTRVFLLPGSFITVVSSGLNSSLVFSNSKPVAAIDSQKNVFKISLMGFTGGFPFGIFSVNRITVDNSWQNDPFPQPTFLPETITGGPINPTITASTAGLWFGICPPISNPLIADPLAFPWNLFPVNANGNAIFDNMPYRGGTFVTGQPASPVYIPFEKQPSPPPWVSLCHYQSGFVICDSNGNFQQALTSGRTGQNESAWPTVLNAQTKEPDYHGAHSETGVFWKLIKICSFKSPRSRMFSLPCYPFFKDTDGGPPWNLAGLGFNPIFWWIYKISINRFGDAAGNPQGGSIPVSLGCIRNGVFTLFGTWGTGSVIDAMWPIFTNTALCYQAAERVDIQATVCGYGNPGGTSVDYPILAAYSSDISAVSSLL